MSNEQKAVHPLFTREVRPIQSWVEFLERWEAARTLEEMLGLLHAGFATPEYYFFHRTYDEKKYDGIDRLVFYFALADGWNDSSSLRVRPDDDDKEYRYGRDRNDMNDIRVTPSELRQVVAKKAFDMLCQHFFKKQVEAALVPRGRRDTPWGIRFLSEDRLLTAIMSFFRLKKESLGKDLVVSNLARKPDELSHGEQQAVAFLLNLAKCVFERDGEREDGEMRSRLDSAKLWLIEVLSYVQQLKMLWIAYGPHDPYFTELDEPCRAKLEEIAMRKVFDRYGPGERRVQTLDEACYLGSKAAWFLKEYEMMKTVYDRLDAIRAAEQERKEAERKLAALQQRTIG
jgi:hypothetical protein